MPQSSAPRPAAPLRISVTMPGRMIRRESASPQRRRPMMSQLRPASDAAGLRPFSCGPPFTHGHTRDGALESDRDRSVDERPRHRNRRIHAGQDTDAQRDGKPADRTAAKHKQDEGCEQRCHVRIDNRDKGAVPPRLEGGPQRLACPQFLLDLLKDDDVGVHGHADLLQSVPPSTEANRLMREFIEREIDLVNLKTLLRVWAAKATFDREIFLPGGYET